MPKSLIIRNMEAVGLGTTMPRLNRIFNNADYNRFCEVAERLGVSKTALSIRMEELGILKENYLKDPLALPRVSVGRYERF